MPLRKRFMISTSGTSRPKVISASCQLSRNSAMAMPSIVSTSLATASRPEVSNSFSASMSLVRRVISAPTGWRSKKRSACRSSALEQLEPQVVHGALAGPVQCHRLGVAHAEDGDQHQQVDAGEEIDPLQALGQRRRGVGCQVAIDRCLHQQRTGQLEQRQHHRRPAATSALVVGTR